jgi:hypothetical protein
MTLVTTHNKCYYVRLKLTESETWFVRFKQNVLSILLTIIGHNNNWKTNRLKPPTLVTCQSWLKVYLYMLTLNFISNVITHVRMHTVNRIVKCYCTLIINTTLLATYLINSQSKPDDNGLSIHLSNSNVDLFEVVDNPCIAQRASTSNNGNCTTMTHLYTMRYW